MGKLYLLDVPYAYHFRSSLIYFFHRGINIINPEHAITIMLYSVMPPFLIISKMHSAIHAINRTAKPIYFAYLMVTAKLIQKFETILVCSQLTNKKYIICEMILSNDNTEMMNRIS